jgi:predicted DCC family thiol-disulfide oxidoreductase YuxK
MMNQSTSRNITSSGSKENNRVSNLFQSKVIKLKVFYDRDCPLCNRTRRIVTKFDIFNRIEFLNVQENYLQQEQLKNIDLEMMLTDLYSVNIKSQKTFIGFNTYIQILKQLVYTYPLAILFQIPGIYHIGAYIYKYIAKNRSTERCTEATCGIPNKNNKLTKTTQKFNEVIKPFKNNSILYQNLSHPIL